MCTEERKDQGAGLGNLILGAGSVHGSAVLVSLASHGTISPASTEKVGGTFSDQASFSKPWRNAFIRANVLSADKLVHTDHLIYDENNHVFHLLILDN